MEKFCLAHQALLSFIPTEMPFHFIQVPVHQKLES